jgi:hypothetical protein
VHNAKQLSSSPQSCLAIHDLRPRLERWTLLQSPRLASQLFDEKKFLSPPRERFLDLVPWAWREEEEEDWRKKGA